MPKPPRTLRSLRRSDLAVGVILGTLLGGGVLACTPRARAKKKPAAKTATATPQTPQRQFMPSTPGSFVDLAKALDPSVVTIRQTIGGGHQSPFGDDDPSGGTSLGSGFVIDADGTILTNNHVIEGGGEIKVSLSDGREFKARVVGTDEKTDIGVLKIDGADGLVPAKLGDSDALEVGEWVVAIGNPFALEHTVTAGIVSAKGRRDIPLGPAKNYNWNFIQTDAAINPGNSGGPLINTAAEVIGINTAVDTRGGGIGFAIPINMAKQLLPMLKKDGKVTRAYLGVYIGPLSPSYAKKVGLDPPRGVVIANIEPQAPAARAGIRIGDVVLEFDGQPVDEKSFAFVVQTAGVDRHVPVKIWRDGAETIVDVMTEKLPQ